ncbi:abc subfamily abcg [Nannochloropsis gaditana]|uniref:Abc subfamily abcg n=1 Tax=Nannochloropsis gaditana TaxID=72520 RepID=W7TSX5_9STRA|nr:abc subfamily abcg [Nannochloropsis gaditana]
MNTEGNVRHANGEEKGVVSVGIRHTLEWHVEAYMVPAGKKGEFRNILQGIAGKTESGQLTAIMGPSGCGKTTLLECISLRNRRFDGAVHFDGRAPGGDAFTVSVLVHQKELLFGFMTPREYLTFHGLARMEHTHTRAQIDQRIQEVLSDMKLEKCADTLVGGTDPFFQKKGLSGGERKRLAIAYEMLLAPSMIFLDEPSSGLDSVMSESIFQSLKDLADGGRIVLASVHCPSSEACQLFSHLMLLTYDGRVAYHGPTLQGIGYFSALKYFCPEHYNPADFYLKLISFTPGAEAEGEVQRMDLLNDAFQKSDMRLMKPLPTDNKHRGLAGVHGIKASTFTFLKLNFWRATLRLRRDKTFVVLWGIISFIVGLLLGIIYLQQAPASWRNLLGLLFSLVVADIFMGSLGVIMRFPSEWAIIVRECYSGVNAVGPYLFASFWGILPMAYGPFLLVTVMYWMTGMDPNFVAYLKFAGIYLSFDIACLELGQFVSSLSGNPMVGMTILPAFVAPMIMFSGVLYQKSTVPVWLSWMHHVSLINYSFSALMAEQIHILPENQANLLAAFIDLNKNSAGLNVLYLWIMSAALLLLTYFTLTVRLRNATAS